MKFAKSRCVMSRGRPLVTKRSRHPSLSKSASRGLQLQSVAWIPARAPISLKVGRPSGVRPAWSWRVLRLTCGSYPARISERARATPTVAYIRFNRSLAGGSMSSVTRSRQPSLLTSAASVPIAA